MTTFKAHFVIAPCAIGASFFQMVYKNLLVGPMTYHFFEAIMGMAHPILEMTHYLYILLLRANEYV